MAFCLAATTARAGGFLDASDTLENPFRPFFFLEAGINMDRCPQLGVYREFARSWQAGLELRSWAVNADNRYDLLPEADLHLRKLWLSDEEKESLRNSEYIDLAAGIFPAYHNDGVREGLRAQGRIMVGKYWMPAPQWAGGIDLNIALVKYFDGHPPGVGKLDIWTVTVAVFFGPL